MVANYHNCLASDDIDLRSPRRMSMRLSGLPSCRKNEAGMTLLEVTVAVMLMAISVVPLLISLGGARKRVYDGQVKRTMKQLMEFKLGDMLLDRPEEGDDPIWIDGTEGNFGEQFENDPTKAAWFEEKYYNYSYRIDAEEVDHGTGGGTTGLEESATEPAEPEPEQPENPFGAGGGSNPFGGGEEEELGQIRYRVTLTIYYHPGNASFNRRMSVVTYLRDPHGDEAMSGPGSGGAGGGLGGAFGGAAAAGAGDTTGAAGGANPLPAIGGGGGTSRSAGGGGGGR